jgi:hypothetical protein
MCPLEEIGVVRVFGESERLEVRLDSETPVEDVIELVED